MDDSFGRLVREHRRQRGLTQDELARQVSCATITIRKIEAEAMRPSVQIVERLAATLRVPPEHRDMFIGRSREIGPRPGGRGRASEPRYLGSAAVSPPVTDVVANPYKGLRPFDAVDAADFFGREALVHRLLQALADERDLARFLAIIGPSGSGKSSVVWAGLVPALQRGALPGSATWEVCSLTPGAHPTEALAAALCGPAPGYVDAPELLALLRSSRSGLTSSAQLVRQQRPDANLLLVIDQFEELFTLTSDEAERCHFLDLLTTAVLDDRQPVRVVLTLRADTLDRPLRYVDIGELLQRRSVLVPPMTEEELERAIAGPAARAGLGLERGLAARITHDVLAQPGALPLLQYALTELFEHGDGRILTHAGYDQIGGVRGALVRRAEALYAALDAHGRAVVRQVLLRLLLPTEDGGATSRRLPIDELRSTADGPLVDLVIQRLDQARLVVFDRDLGRQQPTMEIAHETLTRAWPRLREWIQESREALVLHQRLTRAASEWDMGCRDASFLAGGARLAQFAGLDRRAGQDGLVLSATERAFLDASHAAEVAQAAREQQRRADALSSLRAHAAELEAQRRVAHASFIRAEAQRLAGESTRLVLSRGNAELAALLAVRSIRLTYTPQGDEALLAALGLDLPVHRLAGHESDWVRGMQFMQDGRQVVTGGHDGAVIVWDVASGTALHLLKGHPDQVFAVACSPDNTRIASGDRYGDVVIWDAATGAERARFASGSVGVRSICFAPDEDAIYVAGEANPPTVWYWDLTRLQRRPVVDDYGDTILTASLSADGQRLVTGGRDGAARIFDARTGALQQTLRGHTDSIWGSAWSPDGRLVATASADRSVRLWDVVAGRERRQMLHGNEALAVCFSGDGRTVLSCSFDRTARLWDVVSGAELRRLTAHGPDLLWDCALAGDGRTAVTAQSSPLLWDLTRDPEPRMLRGHTSIVRQIGISGDGAVLISAADDWTARLWDLRTNREVQQFARSAPLSAAALSSDGQVLVIGGSDMGSQLYDRASGEALAPLGRGNAYRATFSSDGRFVAYSAWYIDAATDWHVAVGVFDVRERRPVWELDVANHQPVGTLAFVPGGSALLTGGYAWSGGPAMLFDVRTGALRCRVGRNEDWSGAAGVAAAPNGQMAAVGYQDGTIAVVDLTNGHTVRTLTGHFDSVYDLAFSPDGRLLTSASADGTARLWDVASGAELRRFGGHAGAVSTVVFAPDGRSIFTGGDDGTVRQWDVDLDVALRCLSARLLRDLTAEECIRYGLTGGQDPTPPP